MSIDYLIKRFLNAFVPKKFHQDYLKYWEDEGDVDHGKCLIAGPSHIIGLLKTANLDDVINQPWKQYSIKSKLKPKKGEINTMHFDSHFYPVAFIEEIMNKFFKDEDGIEIKLVGDPEKMVVICFKVDNEYCLGLAPRMDTEYLVENDGVWFVESEYVIDKNDEVQEKEIGRTFSKWKKGIATQDVTWLGRKWHKVVYDKSNILEEIEEESDFLLI